MSAPSSKHYEILLPPKRSSTRAYPMAGGEGEWFANEPPSHGKRPSRSRYLVMFVLGAIAILAWQSCSRAARELVAELSPGLRWLAPPAVAADTASDRIEQITHSVDRIASEVAASHEQISRSIDHLTAGQDQMTLEIIRLQALSQFAPSRKEDAQPGHARKAGQRSAR